ncbi:MAG: ABC transporter permease [Clostridia bacterium]|nr:ABC transporter permease [Clostridia bacterium]
MKKTLTKHQAYLLGEKKRKTTIYIWRFGILIAFIALWEILALAGVIDAFIMSSPSRMISTFCSLLSDGTLWTHIGVTLYETVAGFVIATILGTLIAMAFWWWTYLSDVLEPYVVVLNALPKIALGPIIIIWVGAGTSAIITMAVLVCLIITIISMQNAFSSVEKDKLLLMKTMHATKFQTLTKLVIPYSVPAFVSTLKINVGLAWVGSIIGEYLVSKAGLGYLIVYGGQIFKLDLVMTSTVILCALAGAMYAVVVFIEKKITRN